MKQSFPPAVTPGDKIRLSRNSENGSHSIQCLSCDPLITPPMIKPMLKPMISPLPRNKETLHALANQTTNHHGIHACVFR